MSVSTLHIAIDAMSGDRGPSVCVPAALAAAREFPDVRFHLDRRTSRAGARTRGRARAATSICLYSAQVVEMTDHPREALRRKKDSSMRRALDLVKAHEANACVSAGNTGALMAMAHFVLKMLPGVERPAIVSLIPSRGGHTYMLDLGANASCTPEQLVPVRGDGVGAGGRSEGRARATARRPAQHRRGGDQGQRHRAGRAQSAGGERASIMSASSRGTIFFPTRSTWW